VRRLRVLLHGPRTPLRAPCPGPPGPPPARSPPPCATRSGEPIPRIEYTPSEVAVWGDALSNLERLFPSHACKEYQRSYRLFDLRWGR
jgi:hypothetical protein